MIPVWSQGNQSDLVWYTAQKQSNGTYKITIDMGNHNYNEGTYQIACYIVDGNGIQTGITSGSCQMKAPNIYLEAKDAVGTEKRISGKSDKRRSIWKYPSGTVCSMERTGRPG